MTTCYIHGFDAYYCHAPANSMYNCQLKRKSSRVKIDRNFKDIEIQTTIGICYEDIAS